ncbi:DNA cytosine methyltransferase [Flavobacterium sp. DG1-102-2]|uniref:DNA cytosine methyltransferase n=1 Tax=Flavobacterium sp. DG1-102-2 TaxID=3081663 RepID=UPI0029499E2D|nr:DNA cytosine methyltransferase [Flavobacterium sp. DG1-102-2]MDV6169365.1 DNA cytosine methyltransferase [Flavobacterium sp. DG1-102-2]
MMTFGSVCSGVEAAQLAFTRFNYKQLWSSEIAEFPSKVLEHHYPQIPNLGDMTSIPKKILEKKIEAPDLFCGGTPCQAFSLAGWKNGLADERGQLTITFIDIANAIDKVRKEQGNNEAIILWENVEGVLNDKTNAFGNFIAGLAGLDDELKLKKWTKAGYLEGKTRNVAWRVLDAKYFGLPQQRKRLFVLAGGKNFRPDLALFEFGKKDLTIKKRTKAKILQDLFSENEPEANQNYDRVFYKDGHKVEIFREYTDCLYAAYGTKWNGNAAAYNGSLYVSQNDKLRRLTPLECERLMGMPDNYTLIKGSKDTTRFQSIGNSWAVPVISWIGEQIEAYRNQKLFVKDNWQNYLESVGNNLDAKLYLLGDVKRISSTHYLNTTASPYDMKEGSLEEVIEVHGINEKFYLSSAACSGILRRKEERNMKMNPDLERILHINSIEVKDEEVVSSKNSLIYTRI